MGFLALRLAQGPGPTSCSLLALDTVTPWPRLPLAVRPEALGGPRGARALGAEAFVLLGGAELGPPAGAEPARAGGGRGGGLRSPGARNLQ